MIIVTKFITTHKEITIICFNRYQKEIKSNYKNRWASWITATLLHSFFFCLKLSFLNGFPVNIWDICKRSKILWSKPTTPYRQLHQLFSINLKGLVPLERYENMLSDHVILLWQTHSKWKRVTSPILPKASILDTVTIFAFMQFHKILEKGL